MGRGNALSTAVVMPSQSNARVTAPRQPGLEPGVDTQRAATLPTQETRMGPSVDASSRPIDGSRSAPHEVGHITQPAAGDALRSSAGSTARRGEARV